MSEVSAVDSSSASESVSVPSVISDDEEEEALCEGEVVRE